MKRAEESKSTSPLSVVSIEGTDKVEEETKSLNPLHAVFAGDRIFVGCLDNKRMLKEAVLIHHDGADVYQETEGEPEYSYSYYGDFIGTLKINSSISTLAELDPASVLCATYYNTFTDPE